MERRGRAKRRVVVVDNTRLAQDIGGRIRAIRHQAGLSQRELAGTRYTGAYISALEKGVAKPSMAALAYLAERLHAPVESFLGDSSVAWRTLQADLALASGDPGRAVDLYGAALAVTTERRRRAELLRGLAEARCQVGDGDGAGAAAAESGELFSALGHRLEAMEAEYWLGQARSVGGDVAAAREVWLRLLRHTRDGIDIPLAARVRLLRALAGLAEQDGEPESALRYLTEAQTAGAKLDLQSHATSLLEMATRYAAADDLDSAIRLGTQSRTLFKAAELALEVLLTEAASARAHLQFGERERAADLLAHARDVATAVGPVAPLGQIALTEAQLAMEGQDFVTANKKLAEAGDVANRTGDDGLESSVLMAKARLASELGDTAASDTGYERAIDVLRRRGSSRRLRAALIQWASVLSARGDYARANELYQEAGPPPHGAS